jgi:hypothetical protein
MLDGVGQDRSESERKAVLDGIGDLLDQERSRRASVDSRLSAVISLATPANAFIVGIIAFLAGRETAFGATATIAVTFIGFYTVMQLLCAIRGAVHGLGRRGYRGPTPSSKLRQFGEHQAGHTLRQTRESLKCLHNHRRHNNVKVTQMAVAHRAIENAVVGFLLAIALLFVSAVHRGCAGSPAGAPTFRAEQSLKDAEARVMMLERDNAALKKQAEKLLEMEQDVARVLKSLSDVIKDATERTANAKKDADTKIRMIEDENAEMKNIAKNAEQAENEATTKAMALERANVSLKAQIQALNQAARDADVKLEAMEKQLADLKKRVPEPKGPGQKP